MITEELKKLYIAHTGHEPEQIDELPSSGSNRRYFRLIGSPTLIGVSGESVEEKPRLPLHGRTFPQERTARTASVHPLRR